MCGKRSFIQKSQEDCMEQVELTTRKPSLRLLQKEHCKHIHSASMESLGYHGVVKTSDSLNGHPSGWTELSSVIGKKAVRNIFMRVLMMKPKRLCPVKFLKPNRLK